MIKPDHRLEARSHWPCEEQRPRTPHCVAIHPQLQALQAIETIDAFLTLVQPSALQHH